jgi:hypothetical protein
MRGSCFPLCLYLHFTGLPNKSLHFFLPAPLMYHGRFADDRNTNNMVSPDFLSSYISPLYGIDGTCIKN